MNAPGYTTTDYSLLMNAEEYYYDIANPKILCSYEHVGSPPSPPPSPQQEKSGVSRAGLFSKRERRRGAWKYVYDEYLPICDILR